MAISAIIIAGGVLAGAGTAAYQTINASQQQKKSEQEAQRQAAEQQRLLQEAKDKQTQEQKDAATLQDAEANRDIARQRQKTKAALMGGRQGTILTSPLGITGDAAGAPAAGKTLLGS